MPFWGPGGSLENPLEVVYLSLTGASSDSQENISYNNKQWMKYTQEPTNILTTISRNPSRSAVSFSSPCGASSLASASPASVPRPELHSGAVRRHQSRTGVGTSSLLKTSSRFDLPHFG